MRLGMAAVAVIMMGVAVFSRTQNTTDKKSATAQTFSSEESAAIRMLSPLPPLPIDTNKYADSPAAALLGQSFSSTRHFCQTGGAVAAKIQLSMAIDICIPSA